MRPHSIKLRFRVLEVLILLLIVAAGTFFVLVVTEHVEQRMDRLKEQVLSMLEQQIGRRIAYESISPSVFGFLAVREFTVYSLEDPEVLLRIGRLKIYYNIVRLLVTQDPLGSLTEIQIAGSQFSVDYQRDRELIALARELAERGAGSELREGFPLTISGANIALEYRHGDQEIRVSNLFFSLSSARAHYRVSVRAAVEALYSNGSPLAFGSKGPAAPERQTATGRYDPRKPERRWLETRVRITGFVDHAFRWSDLGVKVYSLSTENLALKRQTLQVTFDESNLRVSKIQDRAPLDIQFAFDLDGGDMSVRFAAEGFRPASLMSLTGDLSRYNQLLAVSVTADGSLSYNLYRGTLTYASDLKLALPSGLLPYALTADSRLRGDERIVHLQPLIVDSPVGKARFSGSVLLETLLPAGLLTVEEFVGLPGRAISTTLVLARRDGVLTVDGRELKVGQADFRDLRVRLSPEGQAVAFDLQASIPGDEPGGELQASGLLRWSPRPELSLAAKVRGITPEATARLIAPESRIAETLASRLQPYSISFSAELWSDFQRFSLGSSEVELLERESPDNRLRFSFNASNELLQVDDIELKWGDYRVSGLVEAETAPDRTTARSLLWVQGVPYELEASYVPGEGVTLQGSYGLALSVRARGIGDSSLAPSPYAPLVGSPFRIRTVGFPVPLPGGTMKVSVDAVGILTSGGTLIARSTSSELQDIPLRTMPSNSLELGFTLRDRTLELERVRYSDRLSTVSGGGTAVLANHAPLTLTAALTLADPGGSEAYALNLDIDNGRIAAGELRFERAPLGRLGVTAIVGELAGVIRAGGTLMSPELDVRAALQDGRLNTDALRAELSGRFSRERLILDSLNFEFLSHRLTGAAGSIDLIGGTFGFTSPYRAGYFGKEVRLSVAVEGNMSDSSSLLAGKRLLNRDIDGTFRMSDILIEGRARPDWLLRLRGREGFLAVEGGAREGIEARFGADGAFTAVMRAPLPIQGTARGQLLRGRIESVFEVDSLDMRMIPELTPVEDIWSFLQGTARGSVRIAGPINDPDWFGRMEVTGLVMSVQLSPDPVGPIDGTVFFDEKVFYYPRLTARTGKTRIESEGMFYIDHWVPVAVDLRLYLDQEPGARVRSTFGPMFVDGYGTGTVRILSDGVMTRIEGRVRAMNCRVALERQDQVRPAATPAVPALPLFVDMNIKVGRGIEFFWPAMNFPVVHAYVKQGEEIQILLDESVGDLVIKGRAEIRGGQVFYFDRSFYLKQGSITFEESIGDIDPWIQAVAEARERDVNNEDIRIYLEANNRLSQFSPRFYSIPSRTDVEILNMLGGTILNRFEDTDFGTAAVMLTSDIVGQFGILSPFERAVREVLRLDLFSIRTQFLQNVVMGRILGEGSDLATVNPLDNTTLSLGKYLGADLFLEALIRFQSVNEIGAERNIRTEGEVSLEWTTPFFLLEWTFTPLKPENLFLTDNRIGLSWKFSY